MSSALQLLRTRFLRASSLLVGLLLALPPGSALGAPAMLLDLDGQGPIATVSPGQTFTVDVLASGIPIGSDGKGLFGFGFTLSFDPSFGATAPSADAIWTGLTATSSGLGSVGITSNRFGETSGPSGDGIPLASFDLTVGGPGNFALTLSHFTGPGDNLLFDGSFLDLAPGFFGGGSLLVVPEPGGLGLLGAGFFALGLARSRRLRSRRCARAPRAA